MIQKQLVIDNEAPNRLIPALIQGISGLTSSQIYKSLRKKDVRINGRRVTADQMVAPGDLIEIFLSETDGVKAIETPSKATSTHLQNKLEVVYSDHRIVILNKKPGLVVHGGNLSNLGSQNQETDDTLIGEARRQLRDPGLTLCHRLDRNTGGLIILARRPEYQQAVEALMKDGLLIKRYRCLVRGEPLAGELVRSEDNHKFWQLQSYLEKKSSQSEVYIHDDQRPGDLDVITRYRILRRFPEFGPDYETVSELEVELVTGRTHQIRAHLAHFGHPLLGDGKYGRNAFNRHFKTKNGGTLKYQQLFACQLIFSAAIRKGPLADLAGKTIKIDPVYEIVLP